MRFRRSPSILALFAAHWIIVGSTAALAQVIVAPEPSVVPSSSDAWDVSQGAAMTGFSGFSRWTTENTLPNMLGADIPVRSPITGEPWPGESEKAFFGEDQAIGYVHWIEWQIPAEVTLSGYRLAAAADNLPSYPGARAFTEFRLYVRNTSTMAFDLVDEFQTPGPDYWGTFVRDTAPFTGQEFRAEFTQTASPFNGYVQGPRIYELDAVAVPEPSTFAVISGAALLLFAVWRRTPLPKA